MIDLHVHTNASDGTLSPQEIVRAAADRGIEAIAVTDHDTVAGVEPAVQEGATAGVEVIVGVEISVQWQNGIFHLLGYFVAIDHPELLEALTYLKRCRDERTPKIIAKLDALGINLSLDEVNREAGGGVPGRPHIAKVMQRRRYVEDLQAAFDLYLRRGRPAYVEKPKLSSSQALALITRAGGLPVLAHPHSLMEDNPTRLAEIINDLMRQGLAGIEVYHPKHTLEQTGVFLKLARMLDLAVTGGTDFHGANKPDVELGVIPGCPPLPYSLLDELKKRRESARGDGRPETDFSGDMLGGPPGS